MEPVGTAGRKRPLLRTCGRVGYGTDKDQRTSPGLLGAATPTVSLQFPASWWFPCPRRPHIQGFGAPGCLHQNRLGACYSCPMLGPSLDVLVSEERRKDRDCGSQPPCPGDSQFRNHHPVCSGRTQTRAAPHTEPVSSSLEAPPPSDFWVKGQTFWKSSISPVALRKGAVG